MINDKQEKEILLSSHLALKDNFDYWVKKVIDKYDNLSGKLEDLEDCIQNDYEIIKHLSDTIDDIENEISMIKNILTILMKKDLIREKDKYLNNNKEEQPKDVREVRANG